MIQINDRVAVISKNVVKLHRCYFIGYGVYNGKYTIPYNNKLNSYTKKLSKSFIPCGKFTLDDGRIFYDCEVWIMSEERFIKAFVEDEYKEGWKVIKVNRKSKHLGE